MTPQKSRKAIANTSQPDLAPAAPPQMGHHGQAVVDQLLTRVAELEFCERASGDLVFWIATRPGMLLCEFCSQAAQVLPGDIRCAVCGTASGRSR